MTTIGLAMGGNARTGVEDTLMSERAVAAPGKDAPARRLADITRLLGRPVASVERATELLACRDGGRGHKPKRGRVTDLDIQKWPR